MRQVLLTVWADQTPWAWTALDRMTVGMIEAGVEVTAGLVVDGTHVWMDSEHGAPYDIWSVTGGKLTLVERAIRAPL